MNLSIVLSGMPGDGKTYAAIQIANWVNKHLELPIAESGSLTFNKAAKLVDNFVGVVDDMTIGQFQRNGLHAEYCEVMLSEMDRTGTNRLFLLTTNEVISRENVDAAFFRPGRIQGIITFSRPNQSVKAKFWQDLRNVLAENNYDIDSNMITGLNLCFEPNHFSLAQLFRAKNLIIQDLVLHGSLDTPQGYVERSAPVNVADTKDQAEIIAENFANQSWEEDEFDDNDF